MQGVNQGCELFWHDPHRSGGPIAALGDASGKSLAVVHHALERAADRLLTSKVVGFPANVRQRDAMVFFYFSNTVHGLLDEGKSRLDFWIARP